MGDGFEVSGVEVDVSEKPKAKGFSDPETLAKAQATRAANKETGTATDFEAPKKRGRPAGSTNSPKSKQKDLKGMVMLLVGIHAMVATATMQPDLAIDADEGNVLAEALANVAEHHKIKIDGKTAAYLGLIYAIITVYGPRAVIIAKLRKGNENARPNTPA